MFMARSAWLTSVAASGRAWEGHSVSERYADVSSHTRCIPYF